MNASEVTLIQRSLREVIDTTIKVDGVWGNASKGALLKYQAMFGVDESNAIKLLLAYASKRFVTDDTITAIAASLGVKESYIRAVAEVESNGASFLPDGRVKVLFERHKFYKYLREAMVSSQSSRESVASTLGLPASSSVDTLVDALNKRYSDIFNPTRGGYIGGAAEWDRLGKAMSLCIDPAFMSASYGGYQIMGFNHKYCGYDTAREMVVDFASSENTQFIAVGKFIKANPTMHNALRKGDWATFAAGYNGSSYKDYNYDTKLQAAEAKWANILAKK